jgi:hypothetical protein
MVEPRPKTREGLALVDIDGDALVYDPETEGIHHLNPTAAVVFQLTDGKATVAETTRDMAKAFNAPVDAVAKDVSEVMRELRKLDLLEPEADAVPRRRGRTQHRGIRLDVQPSPCTAKIDSLGWPVQQAYELGPYIVGVRTNSSAFADWLGSTFSDYRSDQELGALHSIRVGDESDSEHAFYRGSLLLARTPDLAEVAELLRAEFESLVFADWDEAIYAEAVVASKNGAAAVLPIAAGARLRELGDEVAEAGLSLQGSGRIAIDPDSGQLVPIPPRLTIPDAALEELARIAPESFGTRRAEAAAGTPRITAVCLPAASPIDAVDYDLLSPVSRAGAVRTLADLQAVNLRVLGARAIVGLAKLTEGVPCYELVHKDADELLAGLLRALEVGA